MRTWQIEIEDQLAKEDSLRESYSRSPSVIESATMETALTESLTQSSGQLQIDFLEALQGETLYSGEAQIARQILKLPQHEILKLFLTEGVDKFRLFESLDAEASASVEYSQKLADGTTVTLEKANLKVKQAQAIYYVGAHSPTDPKKIRLDLFSVGYTAAQVAIDLLSASEGQLPNSELSTALYWYAANLAKWGETKGILAVLEKWPDMKARLFRMLDLDETVKDYGAYRILGRAYMAIPSENSAEGLAFLKKAYESTLRDFEGLTISRHPWNMAYYLAGLANQDQASTFCKLYDAFSEFSDLIQDDPSLLENYNPELVPETSDVLENFRNDSGLKDYAKINC